jgi:hypothetical protein
VPLVHPEQPGLTGLIAVGRPACVVLTSVLHLHSLTATTGVAAVAFKEAITPGSYLIVSSRAAAGTSPALMRRLAVAYAGTTVVTARVAS